MQLVGISELAGSLRVSSRTLRYYEQVGILRSTRLDDRQQRYYDEDAVERIRQIHVLRKMQIPIKDIVTIFQREDMTALVDAFCRKIDAIDGEIASLNDLREIIEQFLSRLRESGVSRISAIPLLYEVATQRIALIDERERQGANMEKLEQIDRNLSKMDEINDIRVCELPDMRALVSIVPDGNGGIVDDMGEGLRQWCAARGIPGRPGMRECFAYFDGEYNTFVFLQRVPEGFVNDGPYPERRIRGGLEAVVSGERDHLVGRYDAAMQWIGKSDRYELDAQDGEQRHPALCDWLTPQEVHRRFDFEQQDIFLPIRLKEPVENK